MSQVNNEVNCTIKKISVNDTVYNDCTCNNCKNTFANIGNFCPYCGIRLIKFRGDKNVDKNL